MKYKTIEEKLLKRKYYKPSFIGNLIYKFVMVDIKAKKYNIHMEIVDDIRKEKGPAFLLFNHLSRIDHVYCLKACFPRSFNMLCEYNEFFRSHLSFVFRLQNILPKKNFTPDVNAIKAITKIINKKGIVAMAPEGLSSNYGTNRPIVPGTGKLFKHFKVPVYFLELKGNYLQNTKVCLDERYGETYAKVYKLFSPEDLDKYSTEQIDDIINEKCTHDEYEWQKEKHIKWKTNGNICSHLDDFCYKCPKCGSEFNMTSEKDYIKCNVCGNGATMDDYYDFHPYKDSIIPDTVSKWCEWERLEIIKEIRSNKNFSFSSKVKIGNLPKYKLLKDLKTSEITGEGIMTIDHDGFHYKGTRYNEEVLIDVKYDKLYSVITPTDATNFSFYINGEFFEFQPETKCVGYVYILIEEMHRLHINFFKNLKSKDFLYKEALEQLEMGQNKKVS